MKMGRKRALAIAVVLWLAALVAFALGIDALAAALVFAATVILLKAKPIARMYFSRDELPESAGPNADEPKCLKCGPISVLG